MMNDIDLARLRKFATNADGGHVSPEYQRVMAAALEEIEQARRHLITPPLVVSGTQRVDDERWRNGGSDRARERVLWQGVAREIGEAMLSHIDCRIHAGGGLIAFGAAGVVLRPPKVESARLEDYGGFRVRIASDNRNQAPSPG